MIGDDLARVAHVALFEGAPEAVADHYKVGRAAQDEYAARSHQKAARATDEGAFKDEILPISIPQKKGDALVVERDEAIRADTSVESLAELKPSYKQYGSVTAGNALGVYDGMSCLAGLSI